MEGAPTAGAGPTTRPLPSVRGARPWRSCSPAKEAFSGQTPESRTPTTTPSPAASVPPRSAHTPSSPLRPRNSGVCTVSSERTSFGQHRGHARQRGQLGGLGAAELGREAVEGHLVGVGRLGVDGGQQVGLRVGEVARRTAWRRRRSGRRTRRRRASWRPGRRRRRCTRPGPGRRAGRRSCRRRTGSGSADAGEVTAAAPARAVAAPARTATLRRPRRGGLSRGRSPSSTGPCAWGHGPPHLLPRIAAESRGCHSSVSRRCAPASAGPPRRRPAPDLRRRPRGRPTGHGVTTRCDPTSRRRRPGVRRSPRRFAAGADGYITLVRGGNRRSGMQERRGCCRSWFPPRTIGV